MKQSIKVVVILIAMGILCLNSNTVTAENKTIIAAADPYPPFVNPEDSDGGLALSIIKAAYKTQGYAVEMKFVPWTRAKSMTISGEYDIIPDIWDSVENQKTMLLSESYAVNEIKFIVRVDDPFEFTGLDSLKGKKVGIVKGYTYSKDLYDSTDFERKEAPNQLINIQNLAIGRIHTTLDDPIVIKDLLSKKAPEILEKIRICNKVFSKNELHISSGLANPRHKEFIDAFNKGLALIKASGEYEKIYQKYGVSSPK